MFIDQVNLTHESLAAWCPRGCNHGWKGLEGPVQLSYPSLAASQGRGGSGGHLLPSEGTILYSKVDQSFIQDLNRKKIFIFHLSL